MKWINRGLSGIAALALGAGSAVNGFADAKLTGHPWKCFEQPLRLEHQNDLWAIPQFHIVCTENLRTRDKDLMARARDEGRFWEIDTGHDLMITEPDAVTAALLEIATCNSSS